MIKLKYSILYLIFQLRIIMHFSISNQTKFEFVPLNANESGNSTKIHGSKNLKQEGLSAAQHVSNSGIKPTSHDLESSKPIINHEIALTKTNNLIKSVMKALSKISFKAPAAQQKVSKFKAIALIVGGLALTALALTGVGAPVALGLVLGGLFLMGAGFHMKSEINEINSKINAHNEYITTFPKDPNLTNPKEPNFSKMKFNDDLDPKIKEKLVDITKKQIRLKHAQNFTDYLLKSKNRDKNFKKQLLKYNNAICDSLGEEGSKSIGISMVNSTESRVEMNRAFKNIQKFIEFQEDTIKNELKLLKEDVLNVENEKADLREENFEFLEDKIKDNILEKDEKKDLLNSLNSFKNNEEIDFPDACQKIINKLGKNHPLLKQIEELSKEYLENFALLNHKNS